VKKCGTGAALLPLAILLAGMLAAGPAAAQGGQQSLYERLGGISGIATVVDDFVNRLAMNKVVTANPRVTEAVEKVGLPALKFRLIQQIAAATGGPEKYTGKSMLDAHRGMQITEAEWNATVQELLASLNRFKVPQKEQQELIALLAPMKPDIVGR
jgi:hemoglobin